MGVWDSFDEEIEKYVEIAIRAAESAGGKVQELGDKGAKAIEKAKLEFEKEKLVKELGRVVAALFITDGLAEISADDVSVREIIFKIKDVESRISELGLDKR